MHRCLRGKIGFQSARECHYIRYRNPLTPEQMCFFILGVMSSIHMSKFTVPDIALAAIDARLCLGCCSITSISCTSACTTHKHSTKRTSWMETMSGPFPVRCLANQIFDCLIVSSVLAKLSVAVVNMSVWTCKVWVYGPGNVHLEIFCARRRSQSAHRHRHLVQVNEACSPRAGASIVGTHACSL